MRIEDFCSDQEDPRWILQQPFTFDEWTYATDAAIAVRIPADQAYPVTDHKIATQLASYFEESNPTLHAMPAFDRPTPAICKDCQGLGRVTECTACNGEGGSSDDENEDRDCDHCHGRGYQPGGQEKCGHCNGDGTLKWATPVRIDEHWISLRYLERIENLPGLKVGWAPFNHGHLNPERTILCFAFQGGEGILMPIKTPSGKP